ncbi:MAG: hypothetical protein VR70_08880 [Rhodospirillaceae bacterium BRH_c57]|nr:MAG: hypothetical protein VR70_08880 [Rhodospirillaceae bacterium BRH_c57]
MASAWRGSWRRASSRAVRASSSRPTRKASMPRSTAAALAWVGVWPEPVASPVAVPVVSFAMVCPRVMIHPPAYPAGPTCRNPPAGWDWAIG